MPRARHYNFEESLCKYKPNIIGFTSVTSVINRCASLASYFKENFDCQTVVGGPHVSVLPTETLLNHDGFDFVVDGEAELIFSSLCHKIIKGDTNYSTIPNLVWRKGDKIISNIKSNFLSNDQIDELPFPA